MNINNIHIAMHRLVITTESTGSSLLNAILDLNQCYLLTCFFSNIIFL